MSITCTLKLHLESDTKRTSCVVSYDPSVSFHHVLKATQSTKFRNWLGRAEQEYEVQTIRLVHVEMFGSRVGFIYLHAHAVPRAGGDPAPKVVLIRGNSVGLLVTVDLTPGAGAGAVHIGQGKGEAPAEGKEDTVFPPPTATRFLALVSQAKLPAGEARCVELCAGMMDETPDAQARGKMVDEMEEEMGIRLTRQVMRRLGTITTSPGLLDERVELFHAHVTLSTEQAQRWVSRVYGEEGTSESTRVQLIPMDAPDLAERVQDGKLWAALALQSRMAR